MMILVSIQHIFLLYAFFTNLFTFFSYSTPAINGKGGFNYPSPLNTCLLLVWRLIDSVLIYHGLKDTFFVIQLKFLWIFIVKKEKKAYCCVYFHFGFNRRNFLKCYICRTLSNLVGYIIGHLIRVCSLWGGEISRNLGVSLYILSESTLGVFTNNLTYYHRH